MIVRLDMMKVNIVPLITTISRVISFGSATEMANVDMDNVCVAVEIMMGKYRARGFSVIAIVADNGFSALKNHPKFIKLNSE